MNKISSYENACLDVALIESIRKHWRGPDTCEQYYFHNVRRNAGTGIKKILDSGFPVVNSSPFDVHPPLKWGEEQKGNREWSVIRNAFFHVDFILQAWQETKDEELLKLCVKIAVDWVDYNIIKNFENRFKWSDICSGLRGFYFAYLINQTFYLDCVGDSDFCALLVGAFAHAEKLLEPANHATSNHAIFQAVGLASLADALDSIADTSSWRVASHNLLFGIMTLQYGTEGIHLEHSPYYHGWVLERLIQVANLTWFTGHEDIQRLLTLAKRNFIHFFHPDGSLAELGESSPATCDWMKSIHPALLYAASGGTQGVAPESPDKIFAESGYVVFRDSFVNGLGSSYLIVSAGHHSKSHKQDDDFTFEWSAFGKRIIIDAGKHSYDSSDDRHYVSSRRAHNVIEIHNCDAFQPEIAVGSSDFATIITDNMKACRIIHPYMSDGLRRQRVLVMFNDYGLAVIDKIDSACDEAISIDHDFTQFFHFAPSVTSLTANNQSFKAPLDFGPCIYGMSVSSGTVPQLSTCYGQREPVIQGWYSPAYGVLEPNHCLEVSSSNTSIIIGTVMFISGDDQEISAPAIEWTDTSFRLSFRLSNAPVEFAWTDLPAPGITILTSTISN